MNIVWESLAEFCCIYWRSRSIRSGNVDNGGICGAEAQELKRYNHWNTMTRHLKMTND